METNKIHLEIEDDTKCNVKGKNLRTTKNPDKVTCIHCMEEEKGMIDRLREIWNS